jgi:cell division septal protein FtsQ
MKANRIKKAKGRRRFPGLAVNVILVATVFSAAIVLYAFISGRQLPVLFPLEKVEFKGNKHLTDEELITLAGVEPMQGIAGIDGKDIAGRLLGSPWVRSVRLMRQLPGTLAVTVTEADPFVLLEMNEQLYLLDDRGKILEEIKGDAVPFLPVISGNPLKEKESFSHALELARLIRARDLTSRWSSISISAHSLNEISVYVDETVVKMGAGGYEEKLENLAALEDEILKRGIPSHYIDLRFTGKAVVKPLLENVEDGEAR